MDHSTIPIERLIESLKETGNLFEEGETPLVDELVRDCQFELALKVLEWALSQRLRAADFDNPELIACIEKIDAIYHHLGPSYSPVAYYIKQLQILAKNDPKRAYFYEKTSLYFFERGMLSDAIKYCKKNLNLLTGNHSALRQTYKNLSFLYYSNHQLALARIYLDKFNKMG